MKMKKRIIDTFIICLIGLAAMMFSLVDITVDLGDILSFLK